MSWIIGYGFYFIINIVNQIIYNMFKNLIYHHTFYLSRIQGNGKNAIAFSIVMIESLEGYDI
jgi:hypothetical protein